MKGNTFFNQPLKLQGRATEKKTGQPQNILKISQDFMRENSNDLLSFKSSFFAQKFKSEATFKNHILDITFLARKFKSVMILKSTKI